MEFFIYWDSSENPLVMLEIQFWVRVNTAETAWRNPASLFWKCTAMFLAALLCGFDWCQGQLWTQMKSQAAQGRALQKAAKYQGCSVSSICDSSPVRPACYHTYLTKRQKGSLPWGEKNNINTSVFPLLPHSSPWRYIYIRWTSSNTVKRIYTYIYIFKHL